TSGAKWAQGFDDATTASHRRAHRSSYAGVAQAALDLERSDPKSSVTFVFLDHGGATIPEGILGPQNSIDPAEAGPGAPQIDQMDNIVGNRHIDGLVLSIGGNDAGFFDVASRLVQADPSVDGSLYQTKLSQIWSDAVDYRNDLVNNRYPQLAQRLNQ